MKKRKDDEGRLIFGQKNGTLTLIPGGRRAYLHLDTSEGWGGLGYVSGPETLRSLALAILAEIPARDRKEVSK